MAVVKHTSKPGWWYLTVSQGKKGKQLYFPFQGTREEAMLQDQLINSQIKGERHTTWPTILQMLPTYTTYYKTIAEPDVVKDMLSVMRRCLLPHFGRLQAHQIINQLVHSYISERLQQHVTVPVRTKTSTTLKELKRTVTHRTIQKELNYLSAMLKWMKKNGHTDVDVEIDKPSKAKTRPKTVKHPLTLDELNRLLDQIPADKKAAVLLMSDAGLRMEEALSLLTADVDLSGGRIIVKGKGGKVLICPILTKRLHDALASACNDKKEYITRNPATDEPYDSIKTLLRLATKRADITKKVTHHVLRHTFSTLILESGASTEARQKLMRHSTLAATELYTHTSAIWMEQQGKSFSDMVNGSLSLCDEMTGGAGI